MGKGDAPFSFSVDVKGGKELFAALGELPRAVERQVERKALKESAQLVRDRAKQLCPVYVQPEFHFDFGLSLNLAAKKIKAIPGLLRDSIRVMASKRRRKNFVSVIIGTADGWFKGRTFYGGVIEFGYRAGKRRRRSVIKSTGDMRREIPAKPFIRPAFDTQKEALISKFITSISDGLAEVWLKQRGGYGD